MILLKPVNIDLMDTDDLVRLVDNFKKRENISKKKYYHLETVSNFILYFSSIKDRARKAEIHKNLTDYLILINEIDQIDHKMGKTLFDQFLLPTSKLYSIYSGFFVYPKIDILVIIFVFLNALIWVVGLPSPVYPVLSLAFFIYFIFIQKKRKENKVYGYFL